MRTTSRRSPASAARPLVAGLIALAAITIPAHAQDSLASPVASGPAFSIGQPSRWQPYSAGLGVFGHGGGAMALLGVYRAVLNPVMGVLGVAGEGYATGGGPSSGGGVRVLAESRALALGVGLDWNFRLHAVSPVIAWRTAVRRGGLLGHGTMLRVDWLPTRHQTFDVGISLPLLQPLAGRTRPRHTDVDLPGAKRSSTPSVALPASAEEALETVADAAALLRVYTNLYSTANERSLRDALREAHADSARATGHLAPRLRGGRTYDAATRSYNEALARAFGAAAGDSALGDTIARRARDGVLSRLILPYDALLGQTKEGDGAIDGLAAAAQGGFERWVRDSSPVPAAARPAVASVEARWLKIVEQVASERLAQWGDSRFIWIPLQLALTPDEYDEQSEVDSLIARAVGRPFTDDNALTYLRSSDLPLEIARSIYATRDYHVLWMHDFTGRLPSGAVDNISYSMVADAYLPALTRAVQRYDSTGRMPLYMILLDEFYYGSRDGRLWMSILADPLHAVIDLPPGNGEREAHLRQRQAELRAAVAASARLQRDAARHGGDRWLRRVVAVDVNITQPSDFSFRSQHIMPPIPFTPDNIMRDHRKIVFYDLNEADPYRGAMYIMGIGIGEQYATASWEDRGYRMRGPATLEVRAALRRLLRRNGFREDQIPLPLRPVRSAQGVEQRTNTGEYIGRALQVHNQVGFGDKQSTVARAMLYSLAPPGSVIIVPDPLWLSEEWAAMLAGAAARGCRVFIIAPALSNAPNQQRVVAAREHDVLLRLLQMRDGLAPELRQSGGELRVGLYDARAQIDDAAGRRREVRDGLRRNPWIHDLIPFDSATLAILDRVTTQTAATGADATTLAPHEPLHPPQLHLKIQLIARPGAISALVRQPGWDRVLARVMEVQSRETAKFAEQFGYVTPDVDTEAVRNTDAMLTGYERSLSEAERRRVSFYFVLGTQNHDARGMVSDGEATVIVSGFHAASGLVDLFFLMTRSAWVESPAELDRYVPPTGGFYRRLARLIRVTL